MDMMAGSTKFGSGFSIILKSLIRSTLKLTSTISLSLPRISLEPPLRPSVPMLFTLMRVMALLTGSTWVRMPSYLTFAVVIIESLLPRMFDDWSPPAAGYGVSVAALLIVV